LLIWQTFLDRHAIKGAKLVWWFGSAYTQRYPCKKNTNCTWPHGFVPVLIHRKEKILSGGFQV